MSDKITILGCGRWASFHAWYQSTVLKNKVLVWGRRDGFYEEIASTHKNQYVTLPKSVEFTNDLDAAIKFSKYIIISISAQAMPEFSAEIAKCNPQNRVFILAMKGIIDQTGERLSEVLKSHIDASNDITVWVGPGHVQDFVAGQPNIMIIDGYDAKVVDDVANKFKSKLARLYQGDDLIGVEIGAAAKNVIGIMAGICDGAGLNSLKGALMARGVYEVAKLIVAMGGKQLTAYGMSHLGDYEATLFSKNGHNRLYGEKLYKGEATDGFLAEGVPTTKAIYDLAKKYNVEMPICGLCYQILYEKKDPDEGLVELLTRGHAREFRF